MSVKTVNLSIEGKNLPVGNVPGGICTREEMTGGGGGEVTGGIYQGKLPEGGGGCPRIIYEWARCV